MAASRGVRAPEFLATSEFGNVFVFCDKYLGMGEPFALGKQVAKSAQIDRARFTSIFEENFVIIHRFVARRVGTALADDLAAETFAIAYRRRSSFDGGRGTVRSWLYGIANNLIRNQWRAEQHLLDLDARLRDEAAYQEDPSLSDERLSASLAASRIAAALATLSRDHREVILLHAWAELSHEEIATALDIAPGTVRSRLSRARAAMAEQLGTFDFDLWLFNESDRRVNEIRNKHE
jgi:RNA polymerase sigma factor (sigma-70 family)